MTGLGCSAQWCFAAKCHWGYLNRTRTRSSTARYSKNPAHETRTGLFKLKTGQAYAWPSTLAAGVAGFLAAAFGAAGFLAAPAFAAADFWAEPAAALTLSATFFTAPAALLVTLLAAKRF